MRKIALLISILFAAALVCVAPPAHADLIACPYPGVGSFTHVDVIASGQGFYCDDPIEVNGAHMHCQQGSGGIGFSAGSSGPGLFSGNESRGFGSFQIGASKWDCGWVCPPRPGDPNILWATIGPPAAQPNPPGGWKDKLKPAVCSVYERGGPYDANSLPPAGLNPFYEMTPPPPDQPVPPPPPPGPSPGAGATPEVIDPVPTNDLSLQPNGR